MLSNNDRGSYRHTYCPTTTPFEIDITLPHSYRQLTNEMPLFNRGIFQRSTYMRSTPPEDIRQASPLQYPTPRRGCDDWYWHSIVQIIFSYMTNDDVEVGVGSEASLQRSEN
jgi:hypothetical protein